MGSKTIVSLLFHVIIISITLTDAEFCYDTGNFTANSTYAKNRDLVLRSLASNVTNNGGFYNTTIGLGNDTVYGLVSVWLPHQLKIVPAASIMLFKLSWQHVQTKKKQFHGEGIHFHVLYAMRIVIFFDHFSHLLLALYIIRVSLTQLLDSLINFGVVWEKR